jgi:hypothetical protein
MTILLESDGGDENGKESMINIIIEKLVIT